MKVDRHSSLFKSKWLEQMLDSPNGQKPPPKKIQNPICREEVIYNQAPKDISVNLSKIQEIGQPGH